MKMAEREPKITMTCQTATATSTTRKWWPIPSRQVGMITRWCSHRKQSMKRRATSIVFSKEDDDGIQFPHNDAIVVTLNIKNYDIHRIFIDNESSMDVLYFDAVLKMRISLECLVWVNFSLVGFVGDTIQVKGMITLTMRMGRYPLWTHLDFLVIRVPSTYNAILGWPDLNAFWTVVSTYYLKVKFPSTHVVGKIHGDQNLARSYYRIKL